MGFGITLGGGGGGGGGAPGIAKVANEAARLALTPLDGDVVIQLDTNEIWQYDTTTTTWIRVSVIKTADAASRVALTGLVDGDLAVQLDTNELWQYNLGTTTWTKIGGTGTPSTFAGYDTNGNLTQISQWTYTANGESFATVALTPADIAGGNTFNVHSKTLTLTPSTNLDDNYYLNWDNVQLNGNNNFANILGRYTEIHKNGNADANVLQAYGSLVEQNGTGTVNFLHGTALEVFAGDGTNASTSIDVRGHNVGIQLRALNTSTSVQGLVVNINSDAGAVVDDVTAISAYSNFGSNIDGYNGVVVGAQIQGTANYYNGYYQNPEIVGAVTNFNGVGINGYGVGAITNFTGFYATPGVDITNFTGLVLGINNTDVTNFYGVNLNPNSAITMADFTGFGARPQTAATNYQGLVAASGGNGTNFTGANIYSGHNFTNYTGIGISPNGTMTDFKGINITPSGNGTDAIMVNASGSGTYANSYTVINADATAATVTPSVGNPTGRKFIFSGNGGAIQTGGEFTTISNLPQLVDGGNVIFTQFDVQAGTPITGTDFLGNNMAGFLNAQDDYSPSAFGLGWAAVGLVGQLAVAAGKTVDKAAFMIAGGSIPAASAGGTISTFALYEALGIIPAGGTITITDMYGFRYVNALGFVPTNEWGISIENTNADNWFAKNVVVGGTTKQPTNTSIGIEIQGTTKAFRPSVLTTAERDALTALSGMIIHNSTNGRLETYNGTSWQALGGGTAIQGTRAAGVSISAATEITPTVGEDAVVFVVGNAGPVTVTATPPVTVTGMTVGQKLKIIGTSDDDTVTYNSDNNLVLNGSYTLAKDYTLDLMYVGTDGVNAAWVETGRSH